MIDTADKHTLEMNLPVSEPIKKGRGRPRKDNALSNAQRQAKWRQKREQQIKALQELAEQTRHHVTENAEFQKPVESMTLELEAAQVRIAELENKLASRNDNALLRSQRDIIEVQKKKIQALEAKLAELENGARLASIHNQRKNRLIEDQKQKIAILESVDGPLKHDHTRLDVLTRAIEQFCVAVFRMANEQDPMLFDVRRRDHDDAAIELAYSLKRGWIASGKEVSAWPVDTCKLKSKKLSSRRLGR